MNTSHILVTGGAGYIGSVLVPELLKRGHTVTVIDNFIYGQHSLLDCCHDPKFTIVRGDARDEPLIAKHVKDADVIIPLACLTGAPICDRYPREAASTNVGAIETIIKVRRKDQKIIFPTSNSGYGVGEQGIFCTEETPLRPVSFYGRLKAEAEKAILASGNSITLRLATVFGVSPRMRLDLLVNDFVHRAVTDRFVVLFESHFKRNYVHIRDVAGAFLYCLENFERMKDNAYNVGLSDANLSKRELCEEIKKQLPEFAIIEAATGTDPDKRNYIVSNEKSERTGFRAAIPLREGIAELVKGFQVIRAKGFSNV